MAEKQPIVVVKKITIQAAGAHGGSWKVAFADFMTALMSFFLVMWLVSQSDQVKKNVSDYFSTPSIIEYNFSNYGVELTLEKLFLDLINEPLKFFQEFITPNDFTPNILAMGSKNVVLHYVADELGDWAQNVEVHSDQFQIEIPASELFADKTSRPAAHFVDIMERLKTITAGLEDALVYVDSIHYVDQEKERKSVVLNRMVEERLDLVSQKIQASLEHSTVDVFGKSQVLLKSEKSKTVEKNKGTTSSVIRIRFQQKELTSEGRKPRKLDEIYGARSQDGSVYDNFVHQLVHKKNPQQNAK